MTYLVTSFVRSEAGATSIEYGLIAMLICVPIILGANAIGTTLGDSFTRMAGLLKTR